MGILRRANRRGKELPILLQEALQSHLRRDSFGQTQITYAGEILLELWFEIGTPTYVEWIRRTAILVQSQKVLLCGLCEQSSRKSENERACLFCKNEQTESAECYTGCPMRYLWEEMQNRCASQGQEPNEQLAGKLSSFVQELSRQTAPNEIFVCCLRDAGERAQSLQQTLASMEKELEARLGYGLYSEDKNDSRTASAISFLERAGCAGGAKGYMIQNERTGTLSTLQNQSVCIPINTMLAVRGGGTKTNGFGVGDDGDAQFTLSAAHEHAVCYSKSTRPHSADEAPTITESDVSPTLNTFDCGEERASTFVCIPEVSRTLSARHDSSPCIDRGQEFVCYESE